MANGALGGVMVVAACVLGRQGWKRCLVAALVASAVLILYFRGYQSPGGHGSVLHSLTTDPLGMLKYLFAYLGSPFAHLSPRGILSEGLAIAAGTLVATASLWIGVRVLFRRHRTVGIDLVLALFLAYLGISAVAIAGGRMLFGMESAVASRYTTPALLAMCCVIIFVRSSLSRRNMDGRGARMAFLAIPLLFLPLQLTTVREDRFVGFEKMTAALSLELGIKDDKQISWIFPNAEWALRIADPASEADVSIFSEPAIHDARQTLGAEYQGRPSVQCALVPPVKEVIDDNWLRLQGGLVQDSLGDAMSPIFLLDSQGRVVGRGLTAEAEPAAHGAARGAPFKAYVKNAVAGDTLTLVVPSACTTTFKLE